jgi:CheY-like chemotaxis protein
MTEATSEVRATPPTRQVQCASARVLVADDDEDFRALARKLLEQAGMEVVEAAGGRQCLELAPSLRVQAIVVDMVMPDQDGIATLCLLKDRLPQTKIVAVSGVDESSLYLGISTTLGADAVLHKSKIGTLPTLIARLLNG